MVEDEKDAAVRGGVRKQKLASKRAQIAAARRPRTAPSFRG
jgi:hypothetical protein